MQENKEKKDSICRAIIICRDFDGLKAIQSEMTNFQGDVVVASDDPRVQRAAINFEGVAQVVFLEKMESFYSVIDSAASIITQINQWLEGLGREDEIPIDLLYWVMHCEGGTTSQRILDLLLLMRSYQELVDRFHPKEIILIQSAIAAWEDDLLFAFAYNIGIRIRVSGRLGFIAWLHKRVLLKYRPIIVGVYWSFKIIKVKLTNLFHLQPRIDNKRFVMVQLYEDGKKHINQTLPLLHALNSIGFQAIVVGWRLGTSIHVLKNEGIAIVELENWVKLSDIIAAWHKTLKSWHRAHAKMLSSDGPFQGNKSGIDENILESVLNISFNYFYFSDVVNRYIIDKASTRFFNVHKPKAASLWTMKFPEARIFYSKLKNYDVKLFQYAHFWPYNFHDPMSFKAIYVPFERHYFFAVSKLHREFLKQRGALNENIFITGINWVSKIKEFAEKHSKQDSRNHLEVSTNSHLYIFFDPSTILRGFLSQQEQVLALMAMLDIAKRYPNIQLIIKPHPTHKKGILEYLVHDFALRNVLVVPSEELPYHALNASDLLVTKFSTIAFEGMYLNVPGIGLIQDGEEKFCLYNKALDYCFSISELTNKISLLIESKENRLNWINKMKQGQQSFFTEHGIKTVSDSSIEIAEILRDKILNSAH